MSRVLSIVTGANRGFGSSICQEFVKFSPNKEQHLDFILFARSADSLKNTKESIKTLSKVANVIEEYGVEMSDIPQVEKTFKDCLDKIEWNKYSKICLVNNHGTLYNLDKIDTFTDFQHIQKNNDINITSFVTISSLFLRKVKALPNFKDLEVTMVNITSLAAIKPFESWGLYCSSKAFREMFSNVIAEENKSSPNFKVLNYSPGPLDTDMQKEVRETCSSEETRQFYLELKKNNNLVAPGDSARALAKLVFTYEFTTGQHIDYYDIKEK
ncbi:hypothetical protein DICPUDRAFT_157402 [Dictyostelium purpureum]|uniref:Sepiapterin reductase n=1 Tax=Dictyostelium purpureum TaxID=5786 RepID=F0ZZ19_DICPU|nr:uncharacterized protein DICPUDRAFT_157402 [Dictyostelium purpureum]EGC30821.1 hypothetical protein DICPUDRAFT_157402 [Dictyostelium purpureum]|eukprot:XP_003292664.1 hypothetical protein DICPUDRAFT_157402 [Dictyostelium purpureum]